MLYNLFEPELQKGGDTMTTREEITLQLALKALEKTAFNSKEDVKNDPAEVFNTIYKNLDKDVY